MKHLPLPVSRETGALLYMLARSTKARRSSSSGLRSGSRPCTLRRPCATMAAAPYHQRVRALQGGARPRQPQGGWRHRFGRDPLETLSVDLPGAIDLVLLDGAKALYPEILSLPESRLRPGALVVADNADVSPDYLSRVRSQASGYMSVPFAEDVELSMRIG